MTLQSLSLIQKCVMSYATVSKSPIAVICIDLYLYLLSSLGVQPAPGRGRGGGGVLPYMGYIDMCRCEGYGFQAVYSSIEYINQSVWV